MAYELLCGRDFSNTLRPNMDTETSEIETAPRRQVTDYHKSIIKCTDEMPATHAFVIKERQLGLDRSLVVYLNRR